jgi:hypothetical protein
MPFPQEKPSKITGPRKLISIHPRADFSIATNGWRRKKIFISWQKRRHKNSSIMMFFAIFLGWRRVIKFSLLSFQDDFEFIFLNEKTIY